jgi:hypothetical protein
MVPVEVRYYNELIWLETEITRFSSAVSHTILLEPSGRFMEYTDNVMQTGQLWVNILENPKCTKTFAGSVLRN